MYCISVNYKNSDVNIRKKLAFSENVQKEFLTETYKRKNRKRVRYSLHL